MEPMASTNGDLLCCTRGIAPKSASSFLNVRDDFRTGDSLVSALLKLTLPLENMGLEGENHHDISAETVESTVAGTQP